MAMVVKNKYRRLGIGRELLIALETSARQRGCVRIELTSGIHREDAHTFYEAQGYSEKRKRFVKVL
jgi:GNAT superfamily N-acetyltransferase